VTVFSAKPVLSLRSLCKSLNLLDVHAKAALDKSPCLIKAVIEELFLLGQMFSPVKPQEFRHNPKCFFISSERTRKGLSVFVKEYSQYLPELFLSAVGFNLYESNISRTIQRTRK
jgi:hypothetical protein